MRVRLELARGLVEADVAVGADAQDLQVDAAGGVDRASRSARTPLPDPSVAPFRKCTRSVDMLTRLNRCCCMNVR